MQATWIITKSKGELQMQDTSGAVTEAGAEEAAPKKVRPPGILVLGGGIAGIQAALNLADYGIQVYLVEDTSTIGGLMARLNKTFPTNDCSICIEAPMMYEVIKNDNIELLTYTELRRAKRQPDGMFKVRLRKKARHVVEEKCKGCGKCVEVCPVAIPDELDGRLGGTRKLISIPIPQAVPNTYFIDMLCRSGQMKEAGACIGGCEVDCIQCRECQIARCVIACKDEGADAVMLWQRDEQIDINVSAIIIASGVEALEPSEHLYGYGDYQNVITHLEYERLTNAGGPTSGDIHRVSDNAPLNSVAWIQCVGRSTHEDRTYCSKVCCMAATKQAIITKEHDQSIDANIFYLDLQSYGKGFFDFQRRASELGVKYIRARPAEVSEEPDTKQIRIKYEDIQAGETKELVVDTLVLSTALVPTERVKKLAKALKLPLDPNGFFIPKDPVLAPVETDIPGIFLCGGASGPADISESVTSALAASAKAAAIKQK
jgi:heterodisulfide reductase subunit A